MTIYIESDTSQTQEISCVEKKINAEELLSYFSVYNDEDNIINNLKKYKILLVALDNEDCYRVHIFILLKKHNKLYEISASHCSCDGFIYSDPEETFKEALLKREYYCYDSTLDKQIKEFIEKLPNNLSKEI